LNVTELRRQRAGLIETARGILDSAQRANREPSAEERSRFDAMMADADKIEARYLPLERLEAAERSLRESQGRLTVAEHPGRGANEFRGDNRFASEEYRAAYCSYLRGGFGELGHYE
jgi:hypothetical protein